jgi:hypothetical protein
MHIPAGKGNFCAIFCALMQSEATMMKSRLLRYFLIALALVVFSVVYSIAMQFQIVMGPLPRIAPEWWIPNSEKIFRYLSWIHIDTAIGLFILSIPFALSIAFLSNRTAFRTAVIVTVLHFLLGPILYVPFSWDDPTFMHYATWGTDVAKQLVCLPLMSLWFAGILRKFRDLRKGELSV